MKSKINTALIASLSAVALMLATSETFAASRTARGASAHRPGHFFRHHRREPLAAFVWPGDDGSSFGPNGETAFDGIPQAPGVRYTNTNDIPWDWAHRYPPAVMPSDHPYVSSCPAETVTVPDGRGGNGQVNIVRCY